MTDFAYNSALPTRFPKVEQFATIDSTNRYLLDAARDGVANGLVVLADEQTAGRGRLGRTWTAPPGGSLLVSVLLRPSIPVDSWYLVTLAAGIAAAETVAELTDASLVPKLKWPNDLVVPEGKLAGLLAERRGDVLVVGMGLNIDWPAVPDELRDIAAVISLSGATRVPSRDEVLIAWLRRWNGWLTILESPAGAERVRIASEAMSATVGSTVRIQLAEETFEGLAVGITANGHLIVATAEGRREISAGDVTHLRGVSGV